MSDPSLVQISFTVKGRQTPENLKQYLLYLYTNYYDLIKENKTEDQLKELEKQYPNVNILHRNDCYHNVDFSKYNLTISDMEEILKGRNFGIAITSVPRSPDDIDIFLKSVKPYIYSKVQTIGYCHNFDFNAPCYYYYYDNEGNIRKHLIKTNIKDKKIG